MSVRTKEHTIVIDLVDIVIQKNGIVVVVWPYYYYHYSQATGIHPYSHFLEFT